MTRPALDILLRNNTASSEAVAHVTGLDLNRGNAVLVLQADGRTPYYPKSPSDILQPLEVDYAIPLGAPGSTKKITIPHIAGGRIWFSQDGPLNFLVNPGPALVEPSSTNPSDPNYNLNWGFCELTYNDFQLFVNISYVDFVSLPIALQLETDDGEISKVSGFPPNGLDLVCDGLIAQDKRDKAGWSRLIVRTQDGRRNLRALSPNSAIVMQPDLFKEYYQPYIDAVWEKYRSEDLTINTQGHWGDPKGRVGKDGMLAFKDIGSYAKPSAVDIFGCSSGPFSGYPADKADRMGNVGARLAAGFNRSTLHLNDRHPEGETHEKYYCETITNHYSRICHEATLEGKGYAFPYDDVGPSGGKDQSGSLWDGNPRLLTVTLGGEK